MDSFFGIGVFELFLIAVIALVVMGPERLPGAMRTIAGYMRQIRNISSEFTSQFSEEIKMLEEMDPRRIVNDVLDPAKLAAPANKTPLAKSTPAKPAATSSAAKSTAAAAAVAYAKESAPSSAASHTRAPQAAVTANGDDQPLAASSPAPNGVPAPTPEVDLPAAPADDGASAPAEAAR